MNAPIVVYVDTDKSEDPVTRVATDLASERATGLILFDAAAGSALSEPVPTGWSRL